MPACNAQATCQSCPWKSSCVGVSGLAFYLVVVADGGVDMRVAQGEGERDGGLSHSVVV